MRVFIVLLVTAGLIAVTVAHLPIMLVIVLGTALWAAVDSANLELHKYNGGVGHPIVVFIVIVLIWIIFFPLYLVTRSRCLAGQLTLKKKYREQDGLGGSPDGQPSQTAPCVHDAVESGVTADRPRDAGSSDITTPPA
jgi:hypothetical protein